MWSHVLILKERKEFSLKVSGVIWSPADLYAGFSFYIAGSLDQTRVTHSPLMSRP